MGPAGREMRMRANLTLVVSIETSKKPKRKSVKSVKGFASTKSNSVSKKRLGRIGKYLFESFIWRASAHFAAEHHAEIVEKLKELFPHLM